MRILIIRRGAVGDTVVTLPTLGILRTCYPDAYIEVIGNPDYWEIAHKRYYVDAVSKGDAKLTPELYSRGGEIGKGLSHYFSSFDLIIGYVSDPDGTLSENLRKTGAGRVVTRSPFPKGDERHAADYTALVLTEIGLEVNPPLFPKIHLNDEDLAFAYQFLSSIEHNQAETPSMASLRIEQFSHSAHKPFVAIHPRTYGIKGLPIETFVKIGKWVENTIDAKTMWITGQAEEENIDIIKLNFPSSILFHLQPLPKVAAVLRLSRFYIGCDTGISHLAAAAGAPVIALFGPTNPHVWGPRGSKVWIVKADDMAEFEDENLKEIIYKFDGIGDVKEYRILPYRPEK
ncbi:MAG TPA: glycosyltransferase family 9 protein [Thermodesulfobacteriota bacterium]|nr:glycosyltransferase family 9 protein [Thermodesulfobacteriota bacterium]